MFDLSSLNPFSRGPRKRKKPSARDDERPAREPRASSVRADAPAAEPGAGFHRLPGPFGLSDPFDPLAVGSPAARLDQPTDTHDPDHAFDVPLDRPVADRAAAKKKAKKQESRLPERQPALVAARTSAVRDSLKENVDEVRRAMELPDLKTTMGERVLGEEAARAAKRGDKQALRQSLAALVQKMDLTSPANMAVLMKQEAGTQASGQVQSLLGQGKMTMNATPGGRMFQKIAPILKDYGGVDMQGEVDGAWSGMAERFATNAKGKVDVILGAAPAGGAAVAPGAQGAGASPGAAGAAGIATGGLSGGLNIIDAGDSAQGAGPPPGAVPLGVSEMYTGDAAQPITPGQRMAVPGGIPTDVADAADQSQHVKIERGMPAPGAINVTATDMPADTPRSVVVERGMPAPGAINVTAADMPADTPRSVVPQRGMPAAGAINVTAADMPADTPRSVVPQAGMPSPGALNVTAVDMPPDTPRPADVQQAGRTVVAGQLTLKELVERNPAITEVQLQQVASTPKGGALKSLGSLARDALLQKLQGFGSGN